MKLLSHLAFFILMLNPLHGLAQQTSSIEGWFDTQVGEENSGLINGHEYLFPFRGTFSHPFYNTDAAGKGELVYNHQWYPDVNLMYDIYSNEIILKHVTPEKLVNLICLDIERLQSFKVYGHQFKKINGSIYDILFDGTNWSLLAKRTKSTKVINGKVEFEEEVNYLINEAGQFRSMTKKDLMAMCSQPNDLQVFMKANHIKFGKKNESDLQAIAGFIEKNRNPKK